MKNLVCESLEEYRQLRLLLEQSGKFEEVEQLDEDWRTKMKKGLVGAAMAGSLLGGMPRQAHSQTKEPEQTQQNAENVYKDNLTFLKDHRIQLGEGSSNKEFRHKAEMVLWKNATYRFSMATADTSVGKLVMKLKDISNKTVLTSIDPKTKEISSTIDFTCPKTGVYYMYYDFDEGKSGSGLATIYLVQ